MHVVIHPFIDPANIYLAPKKITGIGDAKTNKTGQ